ncbi:hypothetical protein GCM10022243_28330 [Saccharothrix violaceirubra]
MLAVTSLGLTVAAHGLAGGEVVDAVPALPLTLLIAFGGTALSERLGPRSLLGALGLAQFAQHTLLSLGYHQPMTAVVDPVAMTAAHAVAAVLTGLLLTRADAALSALASAFPRLVPVLPTHPPVVGRLFVPVRSPAPDPLVGVLLRRVHGRRGPPLLPITQGH